MTGNSNSIPSTTESLLTNVRMLWYIRFPIGFMCLLVLLGPLGLIFFARFLGTAIVANSIMQIASLAFICLMASTLAMIQITFILQRGQYWLDDEHINRTLVYKFFQQIQSRTDSKANLSALNWLLLGWKWPWKPTLILLLVGFSLPFWCLLNSLLQRANQDVQKYFTDEPVASWSNAILGLLLGFGLYLVMVQLMGVLQTLFMTTLKFNSQVSDQAHYKPFEHHPVSPILNLRPILAINLKPLPNSLRNLLIPFVAIHHELIFWGLTVISIYAMIFFQTNSQVIDSEHGYTAVFYLVLWLLLIESIFAAVAFFFDRYRMPALLLVVIFFGIYQFWVPYDHRFATINVISTGESNPIESKSVATNLRPDSRNIKIIVVAPGGGIHASAWTGTVLAGLHERYGIDFEDSLHLVSAVSGGSVGAMYYLDHFESLVANNPSRDAAVSTGYKDPKVQTPPKLADRGLDYRKRKYENGLDVVRRRSSTSSLESLFWGLTFPDTFRIFNPWWAIMDRGDAQESLFRERLDLEKKERGPTLLGWHQRAENGQMPYVVFNATEANTGQRVLFSTLPLPNQENAARKFDLGRSDWKPKNFLLLSSGTIDIPISTAVRLSATFPYISPASRPTPESNIELGHVVDGGYADNEGLITAIEEINRLTEIVPGQRKNEFEKNSTPTIVLIRIAHHPRKESELPMERSKESQDSGLEYAAFGPLLAAMNVRDSSQKERGEIELELLRERLNDTQKALSPKFREVTLRFQSNGDIKIPPLNWKLLPKQRSAYQAAWAEIVKDACRTSKADEAVGEGLQILDSLFNYAVKDDCSKSYTESP